MLRRFDLGYEFTDGGTTGGVAAQASPYDVCVRWRKGCGQGNGIRCLVRPRRRHLGERLNDDPTETPNIAGGGTLAVFGFRRIVQGKLGGACRGLAGGTDVVARQFQLIIDDQKVWRLQLALHVALAMKKSQGVQGRE